MYRENKFEMKKRTIAVDGFSSCSKSTMAKVLAKKIGYIYIDSGAMYRAVTLYAIENDLIKDGKPQSEELIKRLPEIEIRFVLNKETGNPEVTLNGVNVEKKIRTMEVSNLVSPVAAIPQVRHAMVEQQQKLGTEKGIIMDGRDIGTTVFPDAELKIFVTASPEVRANRRVAELLAKGDNVTFEEVLENVKSRDEIDKNREESPLRKADDALLLDNSDMTIKEQDEWLMNEFNRVVNS